jgi:hypothetical protein
MEPDGRASLELLQAGALVVEVPTSTVEFFGDQVRGDADSVLVRACDLDIDIADRTAYIEARPPRLAILARVGAYFAESAHSHLGRVSLNSGNLVIAAQVCRSGGRQASRADQDESSSSRP